MEEMTTSYTPPRPTPRASLPKSAVSQAVRTQTIQQRRTATEEDIEEAPRSPTSVRRYVPVQPPVKVQEEPVTQPLQGWTFQRFATWVCFSIGISLMLIVAFIAFVLPRIVEAINTMKYENPRITQADVLFNGQAHHLIALNEHSVIELVDIPSDPSKTIPKYYVVVHLVGDGMDEEPVTNISMMDANGDGNPDIEVTVNKTEYILYGDGKGNFSVVPPTKGK